MVLLMLLVLHTSFNFSLSILRSQFFWRPNITSLIFWFLFFLTRLIGGGDSKTSFRYFHHGVIHHQQNLATWKSSDKIWLWISNSMYVYAVLLGYTSNQKILFSTSSESILHALNHVYRQHSVAILRKLIMLVETKRMLQLQFVTRICQQHRRYDSNFL